MDVEELAGTRQAHIEGSRKSRSLLARGRLPPRGSRTHGRGGRPGIHGVGAVDAWPARSCLCMLAFCGPDRAPGATGRAGAITHCRATADMPGGMAARPCSRIWRSRRT